MTFQLRDDIIRVDIDQHRSSQLYETLLKIN
jgi:hypothetical protein